MTAGTLSHRYAPVLRAVLALPQSLGIIGGRPMQSHYFVGCAGGRLLYLDPHTVQPALRRASPDVRSCHCPVVRLRALRLRQSARSAYSARACFVIRRGVRRHSARCTSSFGEVYVVIRRGERLHSARLCAHGGAHFSQVIGSMPLLEIDPSLALGFLCPDAASFADMCARLGELFEGAGEYALFSIADAAPEILGQGGPADCDDDDEDW